VTQLDLAIAKQGLEETKILHSHGKASDLDLQMATVSVERARIDSLKRENTLEKSKMDLCFLINIDYNPEYIFTDLSYEFLSPEDFSFSEPKNLRISSSAENLKQIKTSYTQTKLDFLPTLSFSLSKSLEWEEKNIFDFDDTASPLRYTLSLSYPLLNPLTNIPSTQSSKYRLRQAELQFDQTREEEKQNFQFALTSFNQGKMSLNLAERQQQLEEQRRRQEQLEQQRLAEAERERQAEIERQRQAELERQRREEAERQRQAELERQKREEEQRRISEINARAQGAFGGNTSNSGGQGTGTNQSQGVTFPGGNQGSPTGDPNAGTYGTGGSGTGDQGSGISYSLSGRSARSLPKPVYPGDDEGLVVVKVTVDKNGNVTAAEPGARGTTIMDQRFWSEARQAALKAKFNIDENAPAFQQGTISYRFRLN